MSTPQPYVYPVVTLGDIHDGDTINRCIVDLGFDTLRRVDVRLHGLDTPEVTGPQKVAGLAVRDAVKKWFQWNPDVVLESRELDKYGRTLAILHSRKTNAVLNDWLVEMDMARIYDGGTRPPWSAAATARAAAAAQEYLELKP